jgi:hypothetical protein
MAVRKIADLLDFHRLNNEHAFDEKEQVNQSCTRFMHIQYVENGLNK